MEYKVGDRIRYMNNEYVIYEVCKDSYKAIDCTNCISCVWLDFKESDKFSFIEKVKPSPEAIKLYNEDMERISKRRSMGVIYEDEYNRLYDFAKKNLATDGLLYAVRLTNALTPKRW